MEHTYCDVCKKEVENPVPEVNFFQFAHIDMCETCRNNLEVAVMKTVREKSPFSFEWYDDLRMQVVKQGIQKGGIEIKRPR